MTTHHDELRRTYLGAAPHTACMGLVWILSAALWELGLSTGVTILVFFFGAGGAFGLGELLRRAMGYGDHLSPGNELPNLFRYLGATIPLSFPVVYMAMQHNTNWFFSAFAIIVGGHYLPFVWAYRMPGFGLLGALLIAAGCGCAYFLPGQFTTPAFLTGGLMLVFAAGHFRLVRAQLARRDAPS